MKVFHLNCGSLLPRFPQVESIVYCLLIETDGGLILVDTGFGTRDYAEPSPMMRVFLGLMGTPGDIEETALHQVRALGYDRSDVHHIVLTHLHLDHAGGLPDFPDSKVHVYAREYEAAMRPKGLVERGCDASHWRHNPKWVLYDQIDGEWFGYDSIRVMDDLDLDIRLIPLPGHTRGHCGVAIKTPQGWLLDCGDAASPYHYHSDLHRDEDDREYFSFPNWIADWALGPHTQNLRKLKTDFGEHIEVFSGHDAYTFRRFRDGT